MSTQMLYLTGLMSVLTDQIKVELMFVFPLNLLWLFDFTLEGYSACRMYLFHQSHDTMTPFIDLCRTVSLNVFMHLKIPMIHFILNEKDEPIYLIVLQFQKFVLVIVKFTMAHEATRTTEITPESVSWLFKWSHSSWVVQWDPAQGGLDATGHCGRTAMLGGLWHNRNEISKYCSWSQNFKPPPRATGLVVASQRHQYALQGPQWSFSLNLLPGQGIFGIWPLEAFQL